MKIASFGIFLASLATLACNSAAADNVTVNFTARVTHISDPGDALQGQVAQGQLFTGFYRYDSNAQPIYAGSNVTNYSILGTRGGLRLENDAVAIESQVTSNPLGTVEVANNPPNRGSDWFTMSYSNNVISNGSALLSVAFRFYDDTGRALNSTEILTSAPELQNYNAWDRTITITGSDNNNYFYLDLIIESVELVPPPILEVSPQAGTFLPQQRFDAALYLPAGSTVWYAQAYAGGQQLPLSYPGTCELAPPNSSGLSTVFCPDAHAALATVPNVTQVEWRVDLSDGNILTKVVDWKLLQ